MYVITGASGNTGSVVAHALLEQGKQVRVVGRNASHLSHLVDLGAEAVVADVTDTAKLTSAFTGAEAVYTMIPPNTAASDTFAYDAQVTNSFVSALTTAKVPYVVNLSSIGAALPSGTGPVVGLHRQEEALNSIAGVNILHLRAGYFMENTVAQAGMIHAMGTAGGPVRGDLKLPMIATRDIGAAAAHALLRLDFKGHQTQELLGPGEITYNEVASIIGNAIGKPDLKYAHLPNEQLRPALASLGMSSNFIDLLLEMTESLNSNRMRALESRSPQNTTPTSYETFVDEEFLPVYQNASKAA